MKVIGYSFMNKKLTGRECFNLRANSKTDTRKKFTKAESDLTLPYLYYNAVPKLQPLAENNL